MSNQSTNHVFMVRPAAFGYNVETAASNSFQQHIENEMVNERALSEFDQMVSGLKNAGVSISIFQDTATPPKPDALFPNNWVSLHADGSVVLYPMLAENRRLERNINFINQLQQSFTIKRVLDLTDEESNNRFLEGTGSIVFDHINKLAFAGISPRTNENLLSDLCAEMGYVPVIFETDDKQRKAIYHTNVLMAIGTNWAVCCVEAIKNEYRAKVKALLEAGKRTLVTISLHQMNAFAGNVLDLKSKTNDTLIALSQTAYDALDAAQKGALSQHGKLLPISIPTIEKIGGGSVRCMLAEIFLLPKPDAIPLS